MRKTGLYFLILALGAVACPGFGFAEEIITSGEPDASALTVSENLQNQEHGQVKTQEIIQLKLNKTGTKNGDKQGQALPNDNERTKVSDPLQKADIKSESKKEIKVEKSSGRKEVASQQNAQRSTTNVPRPLSRTLNYDDFEDQPVAGSTTPPVDAAKKTKAVKGPPKNEAPPMDNSTIKLYEFAAPSTLKFQGGGGKNILVKSIGFNNERINYLVFAIVLPLFLILLRKSGFSHAARSDATMRNIPPVSKLKDRLPKQIFFDETGARWKKFKSVALIIIFDILLILGWTSPFILNPLKYENIMAAPQKESVGFPKDLAYEIDRKNIPTIGEGVFYRVVRVVNTGGYQLLDPFNQKLLRQATPDEAKILARHGYAIERFGNKSQRRIVLTFDDGPDGKYTPQILDLLSKEGAQSTFFIVGRNAIKYPEITKRITQEGHLVGNHTLSHIDFDDHSSLRGREEMITTDRVTRYATGNYTRFARLPYVGDDDETLKDNLRGVLQLQQLGYVNSGYNFDSHDWTFPWDDNREKPIFDGRDIVILLHDAGGDRSATLPYLKQIINEAKKHDYVFTTMEDLLPETGFYGTAQISEADRITYLGSVALFKIPDYFVWFIFYSGLGIVIIWTTLILLFAIISHARFKPPQNRKYKPFVSIIIAAYNEEKTIEKTVKSLKSSSYKKIEIILVNDGSRDKTGRIIDRLAGKYKEVYAIHQKNLGKAAATNSGIALSKGEIVITLDADTLFTPKTIANLIRHFEDERIGAVSGFVTVGNRRNILTRWQALEYISSIAIERTAQRMFGAITIVPGSCSAWRKEAVELAGGYSSDTLTEDFDLTLAVQKLGYKVIHDNEAVSLTEAPETIKSLGKQRFRWMFGNIQTLYKHRGMVLRTRYGFLGMVTLPYFVISITIPVFFLPIVYLQLAATLLAGNFEILLLTTAIFMAVQLLVSIIGIKIARESLVHLLMVPLYRLIYQPLFTYVIYAAFIKAVRGTYATWNKVSRTGNVQLKDGEAMIDVK